MHIGRFEVVRELKGGGMGSVTLCRAPDGDLVVLKRPYSTDVDAAVRLRDEARLGARLSHPGLVETLDYFEHEGGPVLVVAFVDGLPLEIMRQIGPMPPAVVARTGRVIADALDAIHNAEDEHGRPLHILHRDVTPGNILLTSDGYAKLIDLGIARFSEREAEVTQDGFLRGTMRYLAPELLEGGSYSTATDLWALGMVLWEAALGRFAYRGETDREVLAGIVLGRPMKLAEGERIDPDLRAAIEPLLQRLPVIRTRDAAEAAARFAELEDRYGDTGQLAQQTLADFRQRKEPSIELPVLGPGGGLGDRRYLGDHGFEDVATHAEVETHDPDELLLDDQQDTGFGEDPTLARAAPPPMASLAVAALDVDDEPTHPLLDYGDDPLSPQATVSVPAPIDFDPATGLPRPPVYDGVSMFGDDDDDEATITDLRVPHAAPPPAAEDAPAGETARQVAAVRDALLALELSGEGEPVGAAPHPPLYDDGDDDEPTVTLNGPLPAAAFRSDLEQHAAGFEEGVSVERVTHAPAPEVDLDDLEEMHTLDGLTPVRADAPEVTLRTPAPPFGGKQKAPRAQTPSWDAIAAVKASSTTRSGVHVRTGFDDDDEPTGSRRVARVGLVRRTPAEVEADRQSRPPPEPGVSSRPAVDIDALPAARPRPREEHGELSELSPFSGPTEVAPPPASLLAAAEPSIDLPHMSVRDPTEADTLRLKKLAAARDEREDADPDEDEPTTLDVMRVDGPLPGDSPGELRMDTAVGAKISEMPAPAMPLEPLGPFALTENAFVDEPDEVTNRQVHERKDPSFQGGETVSLNKMASLLDDD